MNNLCLRLHIQNKAVFQRIQKDIKNECPMGTFTWQFYFCIKAAINYKLVFMQFCFL